MLRPYRDVLGRPGAIAMTGAAFVGRLPMAMVGLGIVLLVSLQHGSYALAGALSATEALSNAAIGPQVARLVDRHGQSRVMPWITAVFVVSITAFVVLVHTDLPTVLLFLSVGTAGASTPNTGAFVRTRWAYLLAGKPLQLRTAFAWESVLDEVVFIVGPPVATLLALGVKDYSTLALCVVLTIAGTLLLVPQHATEPPPTRERTSSRWVMRYPGLAAVTLVFFFTGGLFGALEVVTVAFAQEQGASLAAGVLLAIYSIASAISGLALGAARVRIGLHKQLVYSTIALAVVTLPWPFIHSIPVLGLAFALAGFACSPLLISAFGLVERLVPNTRMTEALVWSSAGMMVGLAAAAALAGVIIDSAGASTAYALCSICAVAALIALASSYRSLSRAWHEAHA